MAGIIILLILVFTLLSNSANCQNNASVISPAGRILDLNTVTVGGSPDTTWMERSTDSIFRLHPERFVALKNPRQYYQYPLFVALPKIYDSATTVLKDSLAKKLNISSFTKAAIIGLLGFIPYDSAANSRNYVENNRFVDSVFNLRASVNTKFNYPIGNSSQYLDGTGLPTTFPSIPSITGKADKTTTLTINNTTQDLSANRTWSVGTLVAGDTAYLHFRDSVTATNIATNSANISTNSSNIATNTASISSLNTSVSGKVNSTRTLTINSVTQDLSANRTWNVGTLVGNDTLNIKALIATNTTSIATKLAISDTTGKWLSPETAAITYQPIGSYLTATTGDARYPVLSGSYINPSWITSLPYSKITGTPTLATVATTGAYSDLTGKPTNVSSFTNDAGYLTSISAQSFGSLTGKPTTISGYGITDAVSNTRTISTTSPLTGGGDLSANRTFAINDSKADNSTLGAVTFDSIYYKDNNLGLIKFSPTSGSGTVISNAVTINEPKGKITLSSPSILANTNLSITFTNSLITPNSIVNVGINGNGSAISIGLNCYIKSQTTGSAVINLLNLSLLTVFSTGVVIDFFIVN